VGGLYDKGSTIIHISLKGRGKMGYVVKVDNGICTGDGNCKDACPVDVYEIKSGLAVPVNAAECIGCETCVEACEVGAITVVEE
jgi:NAD-dependent dihydropyrimidine dehydrogenase PreA subunit